MEPHLYLACDFHDLGVDRCWPVVWWLDTLHALPSELTFCVCILLLHLGSVYSISLAYCTGNEDKAHTYVAHEFLLLAIIGLFAGHV